MDRSVPPSLHLRLSRLNLPRLRLTSVRRETEVNEVRRRRANTVRQEPITEGNSQPVRSPPYLTSRCRLFMFRLVTLTVPLRDAPGGEEWEVSDRDGTCISGLISVLSLHTPSPLLTIGARSERRERRRPESKVGRR